MCTPARKSGRTTRMLEAAKALAYDGHAVYVVAANIAEAQRLRRIFSDDNLGVKFETLATLGNLDMGKGYLRGAHPNCVVLMDHFAIEDHFGPMLEMLHRFDKE